MKWVSGLLQAKAGSDIDHSHDKDKNLFAFYSRKPNGVVVWPPSLVEYQKVHKGYLPFVFAGQFCSEGALSGVLLVNADIKGDETIWAKLQFGAVPGAALPQIEVYNVGRNAEFPEIDCEAVLVLSSRESGRVSKGMCEKELLEISCVLKKYDRLSCVNNAEVMMAVKAITDRHCGLSSTEARAQFCDWFVMEMQGKGSISGQDMYCVVKRPLVRPIFTAVPK